VIRADRRNAGRLCIDGHDDAERLYLLAGQEVQIEVSDIHKIHVLGDVEETGYDWIAL
jgi:hypothetical protein